uniref:Uncharacterized protein n=1 Tax=Pithovirus LCPAC404 TaxID=2506597 RepID=A0A481ZCE8_9VIRU|nr:MAG: hypothetical protein LCPAC404_01610 [Pithovirus LCPAC404]
MKTFFTALFALIGSTNAINMFAAQTAATTALQNAFRLNNEAGRDAWLDAVHPNFHSDSFCESDYLFLSGFSACIAVPLNSSEFYDLNVPFFDVINNRTTFVWETQDDPFFDKNNEAYGVMNTEFDEIFPGGVAGQSTKLMVHITAAIDGAKWKVIQWNISQDTAREQNIICRAFTAFGFPDPPCVVDAIPSSSLLLEARESFDATTAKIRFMKHYNSMHN